MSGKSISTGTLSLRFMQNAHRAKQLKEVELDRAEVKDDGMWEVSKAVRDAWGLQRNSDSSFNDVHESSYLPFIFSPTHSVELDDSVPEAPFRKIMGRRMFNSEGEEVSHSQSASTPDVVQPSAPPTTADDSESPPKRKIHRRPISIFASRTSEQLKGFEQKDTKTARQSIFESGGVGTDLRAPSRKTAVTSTSTTFLKPAGVDDPKNSHVLPSGEDARLKQTKRERDSGDEPSNSKKKPKKKKSE